MCRSAHLSLGTPNTPNINKTFFLKFLRYCEYAETYLLLPPLLYKKNQTLNTNNLFSHKCLKLLAVLVELVDCYNYALMLCTYYFKITLHYKKTIITI